MAAVLGYANRVDGAVLSGGTWASDYPLANIQTRFLRQQARSAGTTATISLDVGSSQTLGVMALAGCNLSSTAGIRIVNSAGYDSGALGVYGGYEFGISFTAAASRYWTITVTDTNNADGYVAIGRVFLGYAFRPAAGIDWDASIQIESRTQIVEALSGPEYFYTRSNRRVWRGSWSWLTDQESYGVLMQIVRNSDIWQEVYWIEEELDTDHRSQRQFLGRFRTLDAIQWPHLDTHSFGCEIAEVL